MKHRFILALCAAAALSVLSGCSAENFEAKSYTASAPVSGVCIDVRDREIEVGLSDDELVHIGYYESESSDYDISVSEEGVLTMTAGSGAGLSRFFGVKPSGEARTISLQVPSGLLASLEIGTTNEAITLPALAVTGSVTLTDNHGDISFDALDVGSSLWIENKNGDIRGAVAGGYDEFAITSESKKGENSLPASKDGGGKSLYAANNNGDIDISFAAR